jgi:hypothetical protein
MAPVKELLVAYLDAIDERLLDYPDGDGELHPHAVRRLRIHATALLEGSVTPADLAEDWEDWFHLAPAFVAAYGTEELERLQTAATILTAIEERDDVTLTEADRAYLRALSATLDMYPEMHSTDG